MYSLARQLCTHVDFFTHWNESAIWRIPRSLAQGKSQKSRRGRRTKALSSAAAICFSPGGGIILSFGRNASRDARATAGTESAAIYIKPDPSTIATFYSYTGSGGVGERVVARAYTPRTWRARALSQAM